nr:hypothetical protein [Nitrosopumilaceae archaeon]
IIGGKVSIVDNGTGGNCGTIGGDWDAATKTCVLQGDLSCGSVAPNTACIEIQSDDIVFNCKGNQIFENDGTPSGIGIRVEDGVTGVKVKRCDLDNLDTGIEVNNTADIFLFYNTFGLIDNQAINFQNTDNSYIVGNEALNNDVDQMLFYINTKNNHVIGNTVIGGVGSGFFVSGCTNDSFIANTSNEITSFTDGFFIQNCTRSDFINNSAIDNRSEGFTFLSGSRSTVFANISENSEIFSGFSIGSDVSAYVFEHNISNDNGDNSIDFGFDDDSIGNKTGGTANTYEANTCDNNSGGGSDSADGSDLLCTGTNP